MNIRAADSYDDFLDGIQQLTAETGVLEASVAQNGGHGGTCVGVYRRRSDHLAGSLPSSQSSKTVGQM